MTAETPSMVQEMFSKNEGQCAAVQVHRSSAKPATRVGPYSKKDRGRESEEPDGPPPPHGIDQQPAGAAHSRALRTTQAAINSASAPGPHRSALVVLVAWRQNLNHRAVRQNEISRTRGSRKRPDLAQPGRLFQEPNGSRCSE